MSVCAAPTCSHQSFDGSSYYVDVDVLKQYLSYYTIICYKPEYIYFYLRYFAFSITNDRLTQGYTLITI